MQKTGIEYLTHTWNPIAMRCTGISPGCENCWHLRTADRLAANEALPLDERRALIGDGPFILRERELSSPLTTRKPAVIGVQFMGDLFHEDVSDDFVFDVLTVIALAPRHTFLALTKRNPMDFYNTYRPLTDKTWWRDKLASTAFCLFGEEADCQAHNAIEGCLGEGHNVGWPMSNLWSGLTICNQAEADAKLPVFLQVPGKKFLSIEPMLGAISLAKWMHPESDETANMCYEKGFDAVILGGETGPGARPLHPDWVRSVRDQCAAAGVPFFFKQWGEWLPVCQSQDQHITCSGIKILSLDGKARPGCITDKEKGEVFVCKKKAAGRLLDGREHNELPWAK